MVDIPFGNSTAMLVLASIIVALCVAAMLKVFLDRDGGNDETGDGLC